MKYKNKKFIKSSLNIKQSRCIPPNLDEKRKNTINKINKEKLNETVKNKKIYVLIFIGILILTSSSKFDYSLNKKNITNFNITAINYANNKFKDAQKLNSFTAIKYGKVNQVIEYNECNISSSFLKTNKEILFKKRGGGYWIWKPYFILKTLKEKVKNNDYLIYADSGTIYINSTYNLLSVLIRDKIDIMSFFLPYTEKHWTKRDAFLLMNCDTPKYTESKQKLATFILMKNTNFTRSFMSEWLRYAQDKRIVTDQPNVLGKPNYPHFQENRHDQSIFSLLILKYNLTSYRNPYLCSLDNDTKSTYPVTFYKKSFPYVSLKEFINSTKFIKSNSNCKRIGIYSLQEFADSVNKNPN